MSNGLRKVTRALWRGSHNLAYATPIGTRLLIRPEALASSFGPSDAAYAWRLFERHSARLVGLGFDWCCSRILEVGPGRNIGSPLLWWSACGGRDVAVTLWDTFPNMEIGPDLLRASAAALLEEASRREVGTPRRTDALEELAAGRVQPRIEYVVCDQPSFQARKPIPYDLVLSHSCLEHVWDPAPTLKMLADLTATDGWQSNQIDLMDHGSRETNFLEMLEWSDIAYWLTMRFVPGAVNRWRAQQFIDFYAGLGLEIVATDRRTQERLPTDRKRLAKRFRRLDDRELLTTELFIVTRGRRFVARG